jgi:hypothetical protein
MLMASAPLTVALVLVVKGPTTAFNPTIDAAKIAKELAKDSGRRAVRMDSSISQRYLGAV